MMGKQAKGDFTLANWHPEERGIAPPIPKDGWELAMGKATKPDSFEDSWDRGVEVGPGHTVWPQFLSCVMGKT